HSPDRVVRWVPGFIAASPANRRDESGNSHLFSQMKAQIHRLAERRIAMDTGIHRKSRGSGGAWWGGGGLGGVGVGLVAWERVGLGGVGGLGLVAWAGWAWWRGRV